MIYVQLLWSFIQIGLFSFGGGYAALPLIQEQVVSVHGWLTIQEFADVVTISQMTPGPISLNAASFVGTRLGGLRSYHSNLWECAPLFDYCSHISLVLF